MRHIWLAAFLLAALVFGHAARADIGGDAATLFRAGTVAERDAVLARLEATPADPVAAYAAGVGQFFSALETLGVGLHRHGFDNPQSMLLPLLRLPIPSNPSPEKLTYEGFRAILVDFRDRLERSVTTLASVPDDAAIGVEVDLARLGIDLDGDGVIAPQESIVAIMAAIGGNTEAQGDAPVDLVFRFDRADGYWLQGYAEFLMAQADFWLAHDFRQAFDGSFHMLFPAAGLPLQDELVPLDAGDGSIFSSEWRIADFISFVHMVNWPVVEPERRKAARHHLLEMIRLSREDWKAIRAETDNDREWLPGPQQKGVNRLTGLEVGEAEVQAWHQTLQMAEDLLEGRALLPHFRIANKGINMKRFFEEPQTFDLVLAITGPGIVLYLEEGKVLTSEDFNQIQRQFGGGGFMTFALWFN